MIKVEDATHRLRRHRQITIEGTEKEIERLVSLLAFLVDEIDIDRFDKDEVKVIRDFIHSFESACGW